MFNHILSAGQKVLNGGLITRNEALDIAQATGADIYILAALASKIREQYTGNQIDLCSIINGKSGNCSQDCKFCSQSIFHTCAIDTYPLLDDEKIIEYAHSVEKAGAHRFAIVTSGRGITEHDNDFISIIRIIRRLKAETNLRLCVSLGELTEESAFMLKEAGVSRYHHNLETSEEFFPHIVTTHTYQDRIKTIQCARSGGLEICSGGIIGLGESMEQRINLAFALRDLNVDSVPVNMLHAVPGTPLEHEPPLSPLEIIKTIALFRFILPTTSIRSAGGREKLLRDMQSVGLMAGLNGMMVGNYLTTNGRSISEDICLLNDMGYSL
ncbi:biotin synthase BioB [Methanospirillum lacunae]|uniref:Biotin synthase n=1 Tax=Methanospirillum lacunae TaxID=668570 RepID=A0A2V2N392_9EURY|nr:biotin synthase BioB [Methanospirillum lacunae]PWR74249.1 biotin synthase BioB [Methanospirillum lacunae]